MLRKALEVCEDVPGAGCEIGVRQGHGSYLMLKHSPAERPHICVDPYGNIEYASWEVRRDRLNNYNDDMFYTTMVDLYTAAKQLQRHLVFFPLEDTEFMERFGTGVPVYTKNHKWMINKYAMVHIDGPHTTDLVMAETRFFLPRLERGACIVYDDIQQYNHDAVDAFLLKSGVISCIGRTDKKAAYKRHLI
jgi:hypothetical protein